MRNEVTHASSSLLEATRAERTVMLQEWLTESIDLMMQARQAHKKVNEHYFNALHVLFDKIYTDAEQCACLIAGRIAQLGGNTQGEPRGTAKDFGLLDIASGRKHVAEQSRAIAYYVELMGRTAWFVESYAHSKN